MKMEEIPCIVIASSSNIKPTSLIKLITKKTLIENDVDNKGILKHQWEIDTKYYIAKVLFVALENESNIQDNLNVEALIIHMDTNKETGLEDLEKWESLESNYNLDVKILACNYCTENTKVTRRSAVEWCLKRGFEFVELYPDKTLLDGDEMKEKEGVERIIEALESHTWSNLIMKGKNNLKQNLNTYKVYDSIPLNLLDVPDTLSENSLMGDIKDDFTEIFSQLHMMKDSLQNMGVNQRKQAAEQMVTAFWKAIGGEEQELTDL